MNLANHRLQRGKILAGGAAAALRRPPAAGRFLLCRFLHLSSLRLHISKPRIPLRSLKFHISRPVFRRSGRPRRFRTDSDGLDECLDRSAVAGGNPAFHKNEEFPPD